MSLLRQMMYSMGSAVIPPALAPTPPVTSGLVHYLHAGYGLALDVNDKVDSWGDTQNSVTWTNSPDKGGKAVYSATSFNGKPGVSFLDNCLLRPGIVNLTNAYTIFELSDTTIPNITLCGNGGSDGGFFLYSDGTTTYHKPGTGSFRSWYTPLADLTGIHSRMLVRSPTAAELTIDGTSKGVIAFLDTEYFSFLAVGDYAVGGGFPYGGVMRCQLVYNRTLTSTEIAQVLAFIEAQK